jgi:hypothetical protein
MNNYAITLNLKILLKNKMTEIKKSGSKTSYVAQAVTHLHFPPAGRQRSGGLHLEAKIVKETPSQQISLVWRSMYLLWPQLHRCHRKKNHGLRLGCKTGDLA